MTHKEIMDRYFELLNELLDMPPDSSYQQQSKDELTRFVASLAAKAAE